MGAAFSASDPGVGEGPSSSSGFSSPRNRLGFLREPVSFLTYGETSGPDRSGSDIAFLTHPVGYSGKFREQVGGLRDGFTGR